MRIEGKRGEGKIEGGWELSLDGAIISEALDNIFIELLDNVLSDVSISAYSDNPLELPIDVIFDNITVTTSEGLGDSLHFQFSYADAIRKMIIFYEDDDYSNKIAADLRKLANEIEQRKR